MFDWFCRCGSHPDWQPKEGQSETTGNRNPPIDALQPRKAPRNAGLVLQHVWLKFNAVASEPARIDRWQFTMRKSFAFPVNARKALLLAWVAVVILAALQGPAQTATSFSENFDGPSINAALQAPGNYSFNGEATNTTGVRTYVSTVASDFLAHDFTATITYTLQGNGFAFFGVGAGLPDANFYGEPLNAIYLRSPPPGFDSGNVHVTLNNNDNVNEGSPIGSASGTSEMQIAKTGDTITFSLDPGTSGSFVPVYSESFSVPGDVAFLDDSDSRLFFGVDTATVVNSLSVNVVPTPEPSAVELSILGGLFGWQVWRRRI